MANAAVDSITKGLKSTTINDDLRTRVEAWVNSPDGEYMRGLFQVESFLKISLPSATTLKRLSLDTPEDRQRLCNIPADIERDLFAQREVVDEGTFKTLLQSGDLVKFLVEGWKPVLKTQSTISINKPTTFFELKKAFDAAFVGPGVKWLEEAVRTYEKLYQPDRHYGKAIAIIQSSGMGKSRAIKELGDKRYLLSVCFRDIKNPWQDPNEGWPPHDTGACQFFFRDAQDLKTTNSGKFKGEELAGAFLGGLMQVVAKQLEAGPTITPNKFSAAWKAELPQPNGLSHREIYFEEIRKAAKLNLQLNVNELVKHRTLMPQPASADPQASGVSKVQNTPAEQASTSGVSRLTPEVSNRRYTRAAMRETQVSADVEPEPTSDTGNRTEWYASIYNTLVRPHAEKIVNFCSNPTNPAKNPFIIAFDECTQLNIGKGSRYPQDTMTFIALQRIIKAGDSDNIWYLFMDTNSEIEHLMPRTGPLSNSYRLVSDGFFPLPPFPYFPFDVMRQPSIPQPPTPGKALQLEFLKRFGRPYWSTVDKQNVLQAAQNKLLGNSTRLFDSTSLDECLAVFSARLLLELGLKEATNRLEVTAVSSHMRILTGIATEAIVNTCSPSEPMLAIAAASLLVTSSARYKAAIDALVKQLILTDLVLERGRQGELLARIILMMARDYAIRGPPTDGVSTQERDNSWSFIDNPSGPNPAVKAVTLEAFLTNLLGSDLGLDLDIKRNKQDQQKLLQWARSRFLNFTHFIQVDRNISKLSPAFLQYCWERGIALTCAYNQPLFDILIILYHGKLNRPFNANNFELLVIQVKLRTKAAERALIQHLTCPPFTSSSTTEDWKPEHLVLLMDLGTSTPFRERCSCLITDDAALPLEGESSWKGYLDEEPNRWCINVRGHSADQYPLLRGTQLDSVFNRDLNASPEEFYDMAENMEKTLIPFPAFES